MGHRDALLIALLGRVLLATSPVSAGSLRWTVTEDCPDAQALQLELRRVLPDPDAILAAFELDGRIVRDEAGAYTLWLQMWSTRMGKRPAVRELQGATCQELLEAAALAVALAADATRVGQPMAFVTPATDDEKPAPSLEASESHARPLGWLLGASALFDMTALPAGGFGAELQLAATYRMLRVGLGGAWLPTRSLSVGAARQADFALLFGHVRGCGQWPLGDAGALTYTCGTFELGRLSSELQSGTRGPSSTLWRALGLAVGGSVPLSSLVALEGWFDLLTPLARPIFLVDGARVYQSPLIAWRAQLGLTFQL